MSANLTITQSVVPVFTKDYAIATYPDGSVVPASPLDNVLVYQDKRNSINCAFYSFLTGKEITADNRASFYAEVQEQIKNKLYPTTDHLFICVKVGAYVFLYVSLDNSVRANINGHPLKDRLHQLCSVIKTFITEYGGSCVIFFSESCRPSFDGGNLNDRKNEMSWFRMRRTIEELCALNYLGECSNNEDTGNMAFGVSAFCTFDYLKIVGGVLPRHILTEGFGSGAIGIKMVTDEIAWGIHFPLDFKNVGSENLQAKTMVNLCKVMDSHIGSICAMGDFNTIPGGIRSSVTDAIASGKQFLADIKELTFFGSFYDIVTRTEQEWILL